MSARPLKLLDVSGFYSESGGGVASYVRQKLAFAARAGHEVVVVAPGKTSGEEARPGGKIVWVAAPPMPGDANYRMFLGSGEAWRVIAAEAPDVIEGSSPWRGGWIAARAPTRAVKSLVFHQDFIAGYPYTALDGLMKRERIDKLFGAWWSYVRRLSGHFDVTVAGGEWLASRLESFGVRNPKAVPFGIETDRFSSAKRDEALRRDLLGLCGAGPETKLVVAIGRLHPEKRHRTIIEGFARARARRGDLALLVIGDGPARVLVERIAARVDGVSLASAVSDRERLAAIYASADLLVHGSGAETYGLVVAEAMSSGLMVVAPDTGGAADLARRGRALTYRTGDAAACGEAILAALDVAESGGGHGRVVPILPSAESHFRQLFGLYRDLIEARARLALARAA